jgi:hypothetical protein
LRPEERRKKKEEVILSHFWLCLAWLCFAALSQGELLFSFWLWMKNNNKKIPKKYFWAWAARSTGLLRHRYKCMIKCSRSTGLPDGIISNPKSQFGYNFEGLGILVLCWYIFGHFEYLTAVLVYFTAIRYVCGHFVCIFWFWYDVPRKIWQPFGILMLLLKWLDLHAKFHFSSKKH